MISTIRATASFLTVAAITVVLTACRSEPDSSLFDALDQDDLPALRAALAAGADANGHVPYEEDSALQYAARYGLASALDALLEAGGNVDVRTVEGESLADLALQSCSAETFDTARRAGVSFEQPALLPRAVLDCESAPFLDWFVDRYPPLRLPGDWIAGLPIPSHEAARHRELQRIAAWTKQFGTGDADSLTRAVYEATRAVDLPRVEQLLTLGAQPGRYALREACRRAETVASDSAPEQKTEQDLASLRRTLVAAGADVNARIDDTPLLFKAIDQANPAAVWFLIGNDVDVDATDRRGRSALHHVAAADWGMVQDSLARRAEIATALIAAGASPMRIDSRGRTPLHDAAREARPGLVQAYLNAGADPDTVDGDGQTAAALARARLPRRPAPSDHAGRAMVELTALGSIVDARLERYHTLLTMLGEPLPDIDPADGSEESPRLRGAFRAR